MLTLRLVFTDGTKESFVVDINDRDELDQFMDELAQGPGSVLLTNQGPLVVPTRNLKFAQITGAGGAAWLEGRVGGEALDDDD